LAILWRILQNYPGVLADTRPISLRQGNLETPASHVDWRSHFCFSLCQDLRPECCPPGIGLPELGASHARRQDERLLVGLCGMLDIVHLLVEVSQVYHVAGVGLDLSRARQSLDGRLTVAGLPEHGGQVSRLLAVHWLGGQSGLIELHGLRRRARLISHLTVKIGGLKSVERHRRVQPAGLLGGGASFGQVIPARQAHAALKVKLNYVEPCQSRCVHYQGEQSQAWNNPP
jgi:hypothetical protein